MSHSGLVHRHEILHYNDRLSTFANLQFTTNSPFNHKVKVRYIFSNRTISISMSSRAIDFVHFSSQLVGQNICFSSRGEYYGRAGRLDKEPGVRCQNPHFPLFCRFMGISGLFKDSDIILEYDDREDRNLFDFSEPKSSVLG